MRTPMAQWLAASGMLLATAFLLLATYFFTKHYWGPAIVKLVMG